MTKAVGREMHLLQPNHAEHMIPWVFSTEAEWPALKNDMAQNEGTEMKRDREEPWPEPHTEGQQVERSPDLQKRHNGRWPSEVHKMRHAHKPVHPHFEMEKAKGKPWASEKSMPKQQRTNKPQTRPKSRGKGPKDTQGPRAGLSGDLHMLGGRAFARCFPLSRVCIGKELSKAILNCIKFGVNTAFEL